MMNLNLLRLFILVSSQSYYCNEIFLLLTRCHWEFVNDIVVVEVSRWLLVTLGRLFLQNCPVGR